MASFNHIMDIEEVVPAYYSMMLTLIPLITCSRRICFWYILVLIPFLRALNRCEELIQRYNGELNSNWAMVGKAVEDCMKAIIGVLLNLTHDNGTRT